MYVSFVNTLCCIFKVAIALSLRIQLYLMCTKVYSRCALFEVIISEGHRLISVFLFVLQ